MRYMPIYGQIHLPWVATYEVYVERCGLGSFKYSPRPVWIIKIPVSGYYCPEPRSRDSYMSPLATNVGDMVPVNGRTEVRDMVLEDAD